MNRLKLDKQISVVSALVEGMSIRAISRLTGVHKNTIMDLLLRVGENCQRLMDCSMIGLPCRTIQADEIWCYVGKKQGHITPKERTERDELGDQYIYVALDADSKLIPCYYIGKRGTYSTEKFIRDLRNRLCGRIQLTTDAFKPYKYAVLSAFGENVDFAMLLKTYAADRTEEHRYSPPKVTAVIHDVIIGDPDEWRISTSYVERQNLTMRMQMRRLTRLTNAFSKKLDNLKAAVALHFAHYNFVRLHQTLKATPCMASGVSDHPWEIQDLLAWT